MYKRFIFLKTKFCLSPTFYWCIHALFCFVFIYLFIYFHGWALLCCFVYFIFHGWAPWFCTSVKLAPHKNKWSPKLCHLFVLICTAKTNVFGCLVSFNNTNRHKSSTNKHQFREIWMALGGEWRYCPGLCLLFLKRGNIYDVHFNGTNKWHQYCAI